MQEAAQVKAREEARKREEEARKREEEAKRQQAEVCTRHHHVAHVTLT